MKKLILFHATLAFVGLTLLSCDQQQQTTERAEDTNEESLQPGDGGEAASAFMLEAYTSNQKLLRATEIAMQHEGAFDQQMVEFLTSLQQEHQSLQTELENIVSRSNIEIPQNIDADQQNDIDELEQASDEEFRDEFNSLADEALSTLRNSMIEMADKAGEHEIRDFARHNLSTIETHSQQFEQFTNQSTN